MSEENIQPAVKPQPGQKNPYAIWFVVLSFIVPVAAAYYMFYFSDIESFGNNGEFIQPYYDIKLLELTQDGEPFDAESLDNKWHMMIVAGSSCDETCQQRLVNLRQISKAVKRPPKVRYAIVLTQAVDEGFKQFIEDEMERAIVLQGNADTVSQHIEKDEPVSQIYLSDPYGNVIMRFSHELGPKLVIKDLNRLF
jgi:hypothetical protein